MKRVLAVLVLAASSTLALANHGNGGGGGDGGHAASGGGGGHAAPAGSAAGPSFSGGHMPGHANYANGRFYYPGTVTRSASGRVIHYPEVTGSAMHSGTHHVTSGHSTSSVTSSRNHSANSHQRSNIHTQAATTQTEGSQKSGGGGGELGKNNHVGTVSMRSRHGRSEKIDPETAQKLRNFNGHKDSLAQAKANHNDNCNHHHDHDWWHDHCSVIIWSDWGWWGWYDGWWYPAWGYDDYSSYAYDGPIYDAGGLPPEQVVANVQTALHHKGYYSHAIDGSLGPQTQAALAKYQADHRIPVTATIDPATLGSLGLTQ